MNKNSKGRVGKKLTNKVKVQGLGTITVPQTSGMLQVSPAPTPGGNDNPESRSRRK